MTGTNQIFLVSNNTSEDLNTCFSNEYCQLSNYSSDSDRVEWYDEIDINSIGLVGYYVPLSIYNDVYNEVEVFYLLDEATVKFNNFKLLFKHEDP